MNERTMCEEASAIRIDPIYVSVAILIFSLFIYIGCYSNDIVPKSKSRRNDILSRSQININQRNGAK